MIGPLPDIPSINSCRRRFQGHMSVPCTRTDFSILASSLSFLKRGEQQPHGYYFETDLVILNRGQMRRATPELALPELIYRYFRSPTSSAAEGLRLLWNSLPDAFFGYEGIERTLRAGAHTHTYIIHADRLTQRV
ncbi:hypothetical protein AVEN_228882-1 [Araneus ventricosus]|uniref:Uncharacterized protein n=1 Tax=Araneus ventricosus TaxID=182803 RepID=A0A4Y2NTM6_ARAVE|nr:hypothetical protein AVEN_228882-1 [Araneus ventricosus]